MLDEFEANVLKDRPELERFAVLPWSIEWRWLPDRGVHVIDEVLRAHLTVLRVTTGVNHVKIDITNREEGKVETMTMQYAPSSAAFVVGEAIQRYIDTFRRNPPKKAAPE